MPTQHRSCHCRCMRVVSTIFPAWFMFLSLPIPSAVGSGTPGGGVQGSIPVSLPPISLFLVLQGKVSPCRGHGCCSRRVRGVFQAGGITAVLTWILPLWFCLPAFGGREDDWKAFCQLRNQYLSY